MREIFPFFFSLQLPGAAVVPGMNVGAGRSCLLYARCWGKQALQ